MSHQEFHQPECICPPPMTPLHLHRHYLSHVRSQKLNTIAFTSGRKFCCVGARDWTALCMTHGHDRRSSGHSAHTSNGYQRPSNLGMEKGSGDIIAVGAFVDQVHENLSANEDDIMQAKSMFVCETLRKKMKMTRRLFSIMLRLA